jgi:hypothetical protein
MEAVSDASDLPIPPEVMALFPEGSVAELEEMSMLWAPWAASLQGLQLLAKSVEPDEIPAFMAGIRSILHELINVTLVPGAQLTQAVRQVRELGRYMDGWSLSSRLAANAEWLRQMHESPGGPLDKEQPVTIEELRELLRNE